PLCLTFCQLCRQNVRHFWLSQLFIHQQLVTQRYIYINYLQSKPWIAVLLKLCIVLAELFLRVDTVVSHILETWFPNPETLQGLAACPAIASDLLRGEHGRRQRMVRSRWAQRNCASMGSP